MTSAERKRRFRRRLYGAAYFGTEGEVVEVQLPIADDADEVAELDALGREVMEDVEQRGVAAVLGEVEPDTATGERNVGVPFAFGRLLPSRRPP